MAARDAVESDALSSAFISPDDPMPDRTGNLPSGAVVRPDAPVAPVAPGAQEDAARAAVEAEDADGDADDDFEEGVVTGMGDDPHLDPGELALGFDPHVHEVVDKVVKLAAELKQRGEAGLATTPGMSRFDVTLRAYCVGYLAGRRAEEEEG